MGAKIPTPFFFIASAFFLKFLGGAFDNVNRFTQRKSLIHPGLVAARVVVAWLGDPSVAALAFSASAPEVAS